MKKVGIITFHGSHNHGSVLQAYATQQTVKQLGYDCEIINFRMESQKEYYSLYRFNYGRNMMAQDFLMLPLQGKRKSLANKFEDFINNKLSLSGKELHNRKELETVSDKYDIYLTGSDQIWSNRIPELVKSKEDFTGVYFLDFVKTDKPRLSYASSVGEITYNELINKKDLLAKFNAVSTREQYGVDLLKKIITKDVALVLDPTFLLNKNDWGKVMTQEQIIKDKYVFLYTLRGLKNGRKWGKAVTEFAKKHGLKFVCVAPFFPITASAAHNMVDAGPLDFLNLMKHAEVVFTDSFHGTAFSINLNKPFYTFVGKNTTDNRKLGVMRQFGLEGRALETLEDIAKIEDYSLEYRNYSKKIDDVREQSRKWLKDALKSISNNMPN